MENKWGKNVVNNITTLHTMIHSADILKAIFSLYFLYVRIQILPYWIDT